MQKRNGVYKDFERIKTPEQVTILLRESLFLSLSEREKGTKLKIEIKFRREIRLIG